MRDAKTDIVDACRVTLSVKEGTINSVQPYVSRIISGDVLFNGFQPLLLKL
jgi:hypothetical protein